MEHLDVIILAYYVALFMFGLNGILWMGIHRKYTEIKVAEERILRLLIRSKRR